MADLAARPERSVVTILVVDTVGSTEHIASIDPDDAQALLDDVYTHIRRTIERAGGLLVSFAGDGGVAVFGWPGSQEDHADRACSAAWEIQHPSEASEPLFAPNGKPIRFRIGIHSGLVGLRQLHLEGGAILDLVGGTVHLAAALEKRAPKGEILISSQTAQLCRSQMQLLDVDGFPSLEKLGARPHHLVARPHRMNATDLAERYQRPMVGREKQLAALVAKLPRKGEPNKSAAIIGDAGLGKSHLVTNIIREARSQPQSIEILLHGGESQNRSTPFSAIRSLIAQALEIDSRSPISALEQALALHGVNLTMQDAKVFSEFWSTSDAKKMPSPAQLRSLLTRIFLKSAVQGPVMIVIDDLHNIDPESARCFEGLEAEETDYPALLLMAGRREGLEIARAITDDIIHLGPLDIEATLEVARAFPAAEGLSEEVLLLAAQRSGGFPFVLEQILSSIAELGDQALQDIPPGVESVIHARLHQLSDSSKALAQALSVLGESVELELARETLGISAGELQRDLVELQRFDLIHPPLGSRIQFRHGLLADACANTVGRGRRIGLHQRAIEAIRSLHPALDGQHERLAHHAEAAGDDALALEHLWQAAKIASRTWSTGSLRLLFDRALPCIKRLGAKAEMRFVDFVLLCYTPSLQLGELTQLNQYLPEADEIAKRHNQPAKICGVQCQLAIIAWFEGRYEEGLPIAQEATHLAEAMQSPPLIFSAKFVLSSMFYGLARLDEAIKVQTELIELLGGDLRLKRLGSAGIPYALSSGYLSWYLMEVGRYDEGLPHSVTAVEVADEANDPYSKLLTRLGLGRNLLMLGRNAEAEAELRLAFRTGLEHGFQPATIHVSGLLAMALSRLGRGAEGKTIYEEMSDKRLNERCSELERFYLHAGGAEAFGAVGETDRALATCAKALDSALAINNQCLISQGFGLRARLRLNVNPKDPNGLKDLARQNRLCREYGLVAWQPEAIGDIAATLATKEPVERPAAL
ncbi:ATP-binding protein [Pseudahrensia aquimaris]|uniref:ATP-binding protein n=1 Tax=Pseudahrensia aquimaris TaxID=744461 RepID=A0ABW3FGN3_9HYPH